MSTIKKISQMPCKIEAFSQNFLTEGKVTHLIRTIPPKQINNFLKDYDDVLRGGFEELIDVKLADKWWAQARLPSIYGGMGLRTGIHTTGAQHLSSLAKCSSDILKFVTDWKGCRVAIDTY